MNSLGELWRPRFFNRGISYTAASLSGGGAIRAGARRSRPSR